MSQATPWEFWKGKIFLPFLVSFTAGVAVLFVGYLGQIGLFKRAILLVITISPVIVLTYHHIRIIEKMHGPSRQIDGFKEVTPIGSRCPLKVYSLNVKGERITLEWQTFGQLLRHLKAGLPGLTGGFDPDVFFGINCAGILTAAYLNHFLNVNAPLGVIKTGRRGNGVEIRQFTRPDTAGVKSVAVVDSRIVSGQTAKLVIDRLRDMYPGVKIYYIVLGGFVRPADADHPTIHSFGWGLDNAPDYRPNFIGCYAAEPGFIGPDEIR